MNKNAILSLVKAVKTCMQNVLKKGEKLITQGQKIHFAGRKIKNKKKQRYIGRAKYARNSFYMYSCIKSLG